MKKINYFPSVQTTTELSDLIFRSAWHLDFLEGFTFNFFTENMELKLDNIIIPNGFSSEIKDKLNSFLKKIRVNTTNIGDNSEWIKDSDAIIKWVENNDDLNILLKKHAKCTIYRVDPKLVRQEGSFYIQCAFDLLPNKETFILESRDKFLALKNKLGSFKESWVLATGPSVGEYTKHDFNESIAIACNSTVLDDDLMKKCEPKILVFADPIFHFGISQYAEEFRKIVRSRLESTDITVIIPFKYYALLCSIFPQYKDRIIGVPFNHHIDFNLDMSENFQVKTTANILTLLLIPVASTFSDSVHILGCDGRPFEEDDYFWGHGTTVQINNKMDNIQEVHPGFFKIDYNEYYYEHCHTLECIIRKGEEAGKIFKHHADSYIPALRDRHETYRLNKCIKDKHVLLIEPDGIGVNGHYVPWYNQVITELKNHTSNITVLCNMKQNTELYLARADQTFTSHSWGISRGDWCFKKGFEKHASFIKFFEQLESYALKYCRDNKTNNITFFMYYSSVQILSGFHSLRDKLKQLKINANFSVCLFHESVILDSSIKGPRLPPNARNILLEATAQTDNYTVTSVTKKLSEHIYEQAGVLTDVMPNPIPNGEYCNTTINSERSVDVSSYRVVFPCALREEKGGELVKNFINDVVSSKLDSEGFQFVVRKFEGTRLESASNITWIDDNISDEDYETLLDSADCIVIPYLAPQFTFRTSGIIVDAMHAQKPIITMDGTWLSEVVKEYHAGISIRHYSSDSFMSAFKVFKENRSTLLKHAVGSFDKYKLEHSWKSLVEVMLQ